MRFSIVIPRDDLDELRLKFACNKLLPTIEPETVTLPEPVLVITRPEY